jgi:flagellar biosynthetic protein FliR
MESLIEQYVIDQLLIYILVFCRVGTVMIIMPGIGDSFVAPNVRLLFALAFTVVVSPVASQFLPEVTTNGHLVGLIISEIVIGFFIGTVARIFMAALDTAGMLISMQMGLGSAMMFNPQMAGQGSVVGAFLSITGALLLFTTNLHHMLIFGMIDSYKTFPVSEGIPMTEGMAVTIAQAVSKSFTIGFYMATPFIVVALFLYIAMGVLGRLMPQIQVFMIAIPIQIMLGLLIFTMILSSMMLFWLNQYDEAIQMFFVKL